MLYLITYKTKALKGEFAAAYATYGYKKDSNDKHHLIIADEVAPIFRKIDDMATYQRLLEKVREEQLS